MSLMGISQIYNDLSGIEQSDFQLNAIPGLAILVFVDGEFYDETTYTVEGSVLSFDAPVPNNKRVVVFSGMGGSFVPQSYIDNLFSQAALRTYVDSIFPTLAPKSGGFKFNGPVQIDDPTHPLHLVNKQTLDQATHGVTQEEFDLEIASKADTSYVNSELAEKIGREEKGAAGGVTPLNDDNQVSAFYLPFAAITDEKEFTHEGSLRYGAAVGRWYPRRPGVLLGIIGHLVHPSSGDDVIIDVLKNGETIYQGLHPKFSIENGASFKEDTLPVGVTFERGDYITLFVENIGTVEPGRNLTVQIEYIYTN